MPNIDVYAGTYQSQPIKINTENQMLIFPSEKAFSKGEPVPIGDIEMIELATEEIVKKINPTWDLSIAKMAEGRSTTLDAAFGILAIGFEMMIQGVNVTFVAKFKNRPPILATTREKTFNQLKAHLQK